MENLWVYKWKDQLNFTMTEILFNKQDGFKIFIPLCSILRYAYMKAEIGVIVARLERQLGIRS